MKKVCNTTGKVFVLMTIFGLLNASIGSATENDNLAWMSLLLGNQMTASSTVKDGVITIDERSVSDIVGSNTGSLEETELQLSGVLADSTKNGSLLYVLPGSDNRFPFGVTGRVSGVTNNGDGTKTVELEKVTYADIFKEAQFNLADIPLDASNFVGVIAPSGVQAIAGAPTIAKSFLGKEVYSFRNGAIVVGASNEILRKSMIAKDGTINAGTVSLNMSVELANMGDGVDNNTMSPVGAGGTVGFTITGALNNIKITNKYDFSLLDGLESADLRIDGDFNFDVKFDGEGSVKFGYFSQAWKEVEEQSFSTLGVSTKLTGLSSKDKIGKYPLAGLVWSVACPNTCPVVTGSTQTPLRQAKAMGVIVWVYLTLEGEFSLEGELSLAHLNPAGLSLGIKKPLNGDFKLVKSLQRKSTSNRLIEAPHLNGTFGAQLKAGITTDLDLFTGGIRIVNAGLDVVALTKMEITGDLSYGTDSLSTPWSWAGDACFRSSLGAGAIARASASFGIDIETIWKDVSGNMEYGIQIPTDDEMNEAGWHGAWFTVVGEDICVGSGTPEGTCTDGGAQTAMWEGREWQRCDDGNIYSWEDAKNYCQELILNGHSDWYLPTKDELKSLVVCSNGKTTPLSDGDTCDDATLGSYTTPTVDSSFQCRSESIYWSSSKPYENDYPIWVVLFYNGGTNWGDFPRPPAASIGSYTRCIR